MRFWRELAHALWLGLRANLAQPRHLVLMLAGFAISSGVLVVLLTIPAGINAMAGNTGRDDIAVVTSGNFGGNGFDRKKAKRIQSLDGVARAGDGKPLVAPQYTAQIKLQNDAGGKDTVLIRGVTPTFWRVIGDTVDLTDGERFEQGHKQLIAGTQVARQHVYARTGASISQRTTSWDVTGEFDAGGSLWDSELWGGLSAVQDAYNGQGKVTAVWVRLTDADALEAFEDALQDDPQLDELTAVGQHAHYASKMVFVNTFAHSAALVLAIILGLGAVLSVSNAVSLSLGARRRDLATLRSMGYRAMALLPALVAEVLVIGLGCAAVLLLVGCVLLPHFGADSLAAGHSMHFALAVDPDVVIWTLIYVLVLGLLAALIPAWRVLRAPLAITLAGE